MLALIFFLILGMSIYFYPVTLRFSYERGKGQLAWLPRVCGGYAAARPLRLRLGSHERGKGQLTWLPRVCSDAAASRSSRSRSGAGKKQRRLRFSWRRLLRQVALDKLDFCLWLTKCGLGGYAECIIHLRGGDIIGDIIHAWRRGRKRRLRHVWRA